MWVSGVKRTLKAVPWRLWVLGVKRTLRAALWVAGRQKDAQASV
jgi:hypothetical protein